MYRPHRAGETIAAIATPPGEGGIAIIRISGKDAFAVGDRLFSRAVSSFKSHTVHHGYILDQNRVPIDEVLLLVMHAPRTFTGEDTVEIHCHGGAISSKKILERASQMGARLALPGEFTFKAFINGKIDLSQAEAISSMIRAKNELAFSKERELLSGVFSKKIQSFQSRILELSAIFEAWVDFPEEGLEFASMEMVSDELNIIANEMKCLLATYNDGARLKTSISLSLIGAPNVGKSSLMNALAGYERAIVTAIAGTTRDLVEEEITFGNLSFRVIDTAGIRKTSDIVEIEGIKRSEETMKRADLILFILDATRTISEDEMQLIEALPKDKSVLIYNKLDQHATNDFIFPPKPEHPHTLGVSAITSYGIDKLKEKIESLIWQKGPIAKEELILTHERHKFALTNVHEALLKCIEGLQKNHSPEILAYELRHALSELGSILGTDVSEEILSSIFSKFCIGK